MRLYDGFVVDDLQSLIAERSDQERTRDERVQHVVEALAVLYEAIGPEPEWQTNAACRGQTDAMFPGHGGDVRPAKALCASCRVAEQCEAWAAENPMQGGILYGTSESQRQRARARQKAA